MKLDLCSDDDTLLNSIVITKQRTGPVLIEDLVIRFRPSLEVQQSTIALEKKHAM
jgi:hypothetical protein